MPELPEVETIRRGLEPHLAGMRIIDHGASGLELRLPVPCQAIEQWIVGHRVEETGRRGKYLLLRMETGALLVLHLGMTGRLGLFPGHEPLARHDHLRLMLDNGLELRFNDARRFGSVQVFSPAELRQGDPFANMGPEPFSRGFTAAHLAKRAHGRSRPVKNFLLDGHIVAGIGNIYASEILFKAGIRPEAPIGTLTLLQWKKIAKETRRVLSRAIDCGGTTIADFVNLRGEAGSFQIELRVYGKEGAPCPHCGKNIRKLVMAGRSTFFCPRCQR